MTATSESINSSVVDAAKTKLKEEGWCTIPNVLDPDRTKDALDKLWKAAKESERQGVDTFMPKLDPNASNVRVFYLLERDALFRELIAHPTAVEMVKSVLGENYLISNFTANIARPGSKSMGLHSDQSLVVPDPWKEPWALNVVWCLNDVYFENGATLFIPGSHKWMNRSDVPDNADQLLRPFEAKAGSIIVMEGRVWHTSGANITVDADRALLFGYYTAPFLRQQVNWTAALSQEVQSSLSPQMREWLGLNVTANTGKVSNLHYLADQYGKGKI
ncbi:PhyH-domain-containing protein [Eremomyces bilateralis CBS 781.70]|uniref:PhyH-domain-containing protein n=1 Tax=Eremomyces bilateralis CBS 781.70 TaxID=1392243 RepID=A0A6G1FX67_9PEZI|nr:PhyH-domain-containing protein [Eremomyces bilateralis CBS 781.70]KAF1810302.1 PhyH-domain-containing protein [Eremomyces bilateralis CBS 781.70]